MENLGPQGGAGACVWLNATFVHTLSAQNLSKVGKVINPAMIADGASKKNAASFGMPCGEILRTRRDLAMRMLLLDESGANA